MPLYCRTYDPKELTDTGFDVEFHKSDNHVYAILEYNTNWQGSVTGITYRADELPDDVLAAAEREWNDQAHDHEPDLETAVLTWLRSVTPESDFKLIRKGRRIR